MTLIILALILAAAYSGAAYLYVFWLALNGRVDPDRAELNTFHLGICFIVAIGFLGLIVRGS